MTWTKPNLTRLQTLPQRISRLEVDRTFPGRIRGVSLITTGPALGHGFEVDRTTVEQVTEHADQLRGRWTHGSLSEDGLGKHLGQWEGVRTEAFLLCEACHKEASSPTCLTCGQETQAAFRSVGDFVFVRSAYRIRPDGLDVPAPAYLMDRAEEDPESLGISVVAQFGFEETEGEEPRRLARISSKKDLKRGDWVADPAANPIGLHAGTDTPSELTEGATRALDRIVARDGVPKARLRALAFLARYFGDEGDPDDELNDLRRQVVALKAADLRRKQAETESYFKELKTQAAKLNAPIPTTDLAQVERLLTVGDVETAKVLGSAFLTRSQALAQQPFKRKTTTSLGPDKDQQKATVQARADMLRGRGYTVELSEDGTQILNTVPPQEGRP